MNPINKTIVQQTFLILLMTLTFSTFANEDFTRGITVIDSDDGPYHFAGPPDAMNGETDIPGHEWVKDGENNFSGRLSNIGPFGAPDFWSTTAGNGEQLYNVTAVIDDWSEAKSLEYFSQGFVQYVGLLNSDTQQFHPTKVAWLKYIAVTSFSLDGAVLSIFTPSIEAYDVTPGVDLILFPNWNIPYDASKPCCH